MYGLHHTMLSPHHMRCVSERSILSIYIYVFTSHVYHVPCEALLCSHEVEAYISTGGLCLSMLPLLSYALYVTYTCAMRYSTSRLSTDVSLQVFTSTYSIGYSRASYLSSGTSGPQIPPNTPFWGPQEVQIPPNTRFPHPEDGPNRPLRGCMGTHPYRS